MRVALPQVRHTETPFTSRLLERHGSPSGILTDLAIRMYVRGLSVRDVDGAFAGATGERLLSKSAVSGLTKALDAELDAWRGLDLSAIPIVARSLDAIFLPLRQGSREQEGVLCAYGVLESGRKVLLHLAIGNRESYDAWLSCLHDLTGRGLGEPVLVYTDGNPGLRRTLLEVFPHALTQRGLVHKMRNILRKLTKAAMAAMERLLHPIFEAWDYPTWLRKGREIIARFPERHGVSRGGPGGVPRPPQALPGASEADPDREPPGAALWGREATDAGHPPLPDRAERSEAPVRHPAHRVQDVARGKDDAGPLARD